MASMFLDVYGSTNHLEEEADSIGYTLPLSVRAFAPSNLHSF
jgi:hypothetical protein